MCAVNPSRISKTFNDKALREVVDDIANRTGCLLEIVNFNVEVSHMLRVGNDGGSLCSRVSNTSAPESWSLCRP